MILRKDYEILKKNGWWARFLSNHDKPRQVSLYGNDREFWSESAKMLACYLHTLPGTPFVFQGEEFGMTNVAFPSIDDYNDIDTRNYYKTMIEQGALLKKHWQNPEVSAVIMQERLCSGTTVQTADFLSILRGWVSIQTTNSLTQKAR